MINKLVALAMAAMVGTSVHEIPTRGFKPTGMLGWNGVASSRMVAEDDTVWVDEISGMFFADDGDTNPMHLAVVKCPGELDPGLDDSAINISGYCTVADRDSDVAFVDVDSPWSAHPDAAPGSFRWAGGTGKYAGLTGINTFTAVTTNKRENGSASGYAIWNR